MSVALSPLLLDILSGRAKSGFAFWYMRQAGRYLPEYREMRARCKDFLALCYTPELACEVTLQPLRRFGMDAVILFSDILVIPQAMGVDLAFTEGNGPRLSPIRDRAAIDKLAVGQVMKFLAPVFETVRLVRRELPVQAALIGFAGAPWTVACYMVEGSGSMNFARVKRFAVQQPENFTRLIEHIEEATITYLQGQIEAGAQVIQLFDSWAGLLDDPEDFSRWVIEPTRRIVNVLKARFPHIPIIGFPRGAGDRYIAYAKKSGVTALSLDQGIELEWAKSQLGKVILQGNLDPGILAEDGARTQAEAARIVDCLGDKPFVFNLGHGILPQTPVEHVHLLSETLKHRRDNEAGRSAQNGSRAI